MSEAKKSLIDTILEGKEELIKAFKAPFIKRTITRALQSARDSVSAQISEAQIAIHNFYENIEGVPGNIDRISQQFDIIRKGEQKKADIEKIYRELYDKPMAKEADLD